MKKKSSDTRYFKNQVEIDRGTVLTNLHFIFLKDCFEIDKSSGLLTWVGEIPKETIKNELVQFIVVAYQQNNEDKQISRTVIITFPGDKNGVNFTQSEYQASLTWVSIGYTHLLSTN